MQQTTFERIELVDNSKNEKEEMYKAQGVQFKNGKVAVCWNQAGNITMYNSMDALRRSHENLTILWVDGC